MRKLTFLIFCLAYYPSTLLADTWFHFKNDTSYYQAYSLIKANGYVPKEQRHSPLRLSISETLPDATIHQLLDKNPEIIAINHDETPIAPVLYYSPFGVPEEKRGLYTLAVWGVASSAVLYHGISAWEWLEHDGKFRFGNENWFSNNSYSGGADKVGHMFSFFFQKRALNWFFIQGGHDLDSANLQSTLLAGVLGLIVEMGDGMTHYRFSYEDVVMDAIGIAFAHALDRYPWLDELVGFKLQYWPSSDLREGLDLKQKRDNVSEDYSGQTYWLTFKASGVPRLNETALRYFTFDLGYYTRGYVPEVSNSKWPDPYRALAIGVGVNLSEVFFKATPKNTATVATSRLLKYWTPPYTVLPLATHKMD